MKVFLLLMYKALKKSSQDGLETSRESIDWAMVLLAAAPVEYVVNHSHRMRFCGLSSIDDLMRDPSFGRSSVTRCSGRCDSCVSFKFFLQEQQYSETKALGL